MIGHAFVLERAAEIVVKLSATQVLQKLLHITPGTSRIVAGVLKRLNRRLPKMGTEGTADYRCSLLETFARLLSCRHRDIASSSWLRGAAAAFGVEIDLGCGLIQLQAARRHLTLPENSRRHARGC